MKEPLNQFIDRLSAALKDATELTEPLQDHLFRSLAFENANSRTKAILATLPQGVGVNEMLLRATPAEQSSQTAAFTAAMQEAITKQGHVIAAALSRGKGKQPDSTKRAEVTNSRPILAFDVEN